MLWVALWGGWEGDARGRRYGDICICVADSLGYKGETNTIVKQLYSNKDVKKKKRGYVTDPGSQEFKSQQAAFRLGTLNPLLATAFWMKCKL